MVKIFHTKRALISGLGGEDKGIDSAYLPYLTHFHRKENETQVNNSGMPFQNTALLSLTCLL